MEKNKKGIKVWKNENKTREKKRGEIFKIIVDNDKEESGKREDNENEIVWKNQVKRRRRRRWRSEDSD